MREGGGVVGRRRARSIFYPAKRDFKSLLAVQ